MASSFSAAAVAALLLTLPCAQAKSLWSTEPAPDTDIIQTSYPIGNGRLAALPFGPPGQQRLSLNRDSLWSGGPFENSSYTGGNPSSSLAGNLPGIRDWIWANGTGNVTALMTPFPNYGSYAVLGNLTIELDGVANYSKYNRSLDLDTGMHTVTFNTNSSAYVIESYCSNPADVCVYSIVSTKSLPDVSLSFENGLLPSSIVNSTCRNGQVRLQGKIEEGGGMTFEAATRLINSQAPVTCDGTILRIPGGAHSALTFAIAAGTNYNQNHGTAKTGFSFKGANPHGYVERTLSAVHSKSAGQLREQHVQDYSSLAGRFTLSLPDTLGSSGVETSELIARYSANNGTSSDPFLESLVFDLSRHLYISAERENSLPANLQGKWAYELVNDWSSDYHANINLQMNHWVAIQTGLGDLETALWDYMAETWVPRGTLTAKLLYDAPGWVTHDEMNIFGHTAMKMGGAQWADYPVAGAWMMQHVWDYFDYSRDASWLRNVGYPLMKGIAIFWLDQLQVDQYFNDNTLVANPCDSPEHGPTTFGCAHSQQLIYQVLETTRQAAVFLGEDESFTKVIQKKLKRLDKGLHIGSWGQVQEWKIDMDVMNDTHRHLSHLVGWYPGWSLSSYLDGYRNETIQNAVATSLWSRGNGVADQNTGWGKAWRSACWARLNNTDEAYYELGLVISNNWAPNALSMYSGHEQPFQIDANFGFGGAVLSMLVVDLPGVDLDDARNVVLGPAIPSAWSGGSVRGLRLRGGAIVDFVWDSDGIVHEATVHNLPSQVELFNKNGDRIRVT